MYNNVEDLQLEIEELNAALASINTKIRKISVEKNNYLHKKDFKKNFVKIPNNIIILLLIILFSFITINRLIKKQSIWTFKYLVFVIIFVIISILIFLLKKVLKIKLNKEQDFIVQLNKTLTKYEAERDSLNSNLEAKVDIIKKVIYIRKFNNQT